MIRLIARLLLVLFMAIFTVSANAANPQPVTITNPSVPVTVVNPASNVTVTNPATNPVRTTEAFPRTPIRILDSPFIPYTVPDGTRLVVETITVHLDCQPEDTIASATVS